MRILVGASHSTIWVLIEALQKEVILAETKVAAFRNGASAPRQKSTYARLENTLQTILARYPAMPILDFLRAVAHNTRLN
jgi:hypothetical protein